MDKEKSTPVNPEAEPAPAADESVREVVPAVPRSSYKRDYPVYGYE